MKNALLALLLAVVSIPSFSQNPYQLNWPRELALTGGSGVGIGVSFLLRRHNPPFTAEQVAALEASRVPAFDRFSVGHYSAAARKGSDVLMYVASAAPLFLLAAPAVREHTSGVSVIVGEVFLANAALTLLTKEITRRPRPFVFGESAPLSDKLERDARLSFFSGHTSTAAAMTFSTAKIWADYHPDSRWRPVVWAVAVAVPATVGYLRMRGGKHFLTDVLAGFAVGAATGWAVPHLHQR